MALRQTDRRPPSGPRSRPREGRLLSPKHRGSQQRLARGTGGHPPTTRPLAGLGPYVLQHGRLRVSHKAHSHAGAGPQRARTAHPPRRPRPLRSRGWAVPSVLGERQSQGSLEGSFLIDAVILQDRK